MTVPPAAIEQLYNAPENQKAELVNGELVLLSPTGWRPGNAGLEITISLRLYARQTRRGFAVPDNVAFTVSLPNRQSFAPDAAYFIGLDPGMRFFAGAPLFAAEVRSENDYGATAEREIAEKIRDYFAAGTLVVWDVDLLSDDVIKKYDARHPDSPSIFRRGDLAEAEPAVAGWTMPVEDLFI